MGECISGLPTPAEVLHQTCSTKPPSPGLLQASRTQLPEELHSQGSVDEEEQHEEEAQVAHLWRQQVGLGRAWGGGGRQAQPEGRGSCNISPDSVSVSATPARPPGGQARSGTEHRTIIKHVWSLCCERPSFKHSTFITAHRDL